MRSEEAQPVAARARRNWLLLAALLLALGAAIAGLRLAEWRKIDSAERERLAVQARAIEQNLTRQLEGAYNALRGVRDDLPGWTAEALPVAASRRLQALSDAMPGVRTLSILDAKGTVLASNRAELIGRDFGEREYLREVLARADPSRVSVSAPFRTALGVYTLNLSMVQQAGDAPPTRVIAASLDPEYFEVVLRSVLYAPDMWAAVAHGDGLPLLWYPRRDHLLGTSLAQPGSMFTRHLESGQRATILSGTTLATGEERLLAQRTLQPEGLPFDKPLVLAVGRDLRALYAPWRQQNAIYGALYAVFSLGGGAAMLSLQRRRAQVQAAAAQQRTDRERLALALQGADLALWDVDLVHGTATVDERWHTMLGHAPGGVPADRAGWLALVHPDDRAHALARQQEHLEGRSDAYEASFRMQHRDGHWVRIFSRGRIVERDGQGRPLRMVGTHMDISGRAAAEAALAASEQKSRALLDVLRSGVVVHGPDTQILDANPSACRLLGLSLDQMRGKVAIDPAWRFIDEHGQPLPLSLYPVNQVRASGSALRNFVLGICRPGLAQPLWVLCNAYAVHDTEGQPQQIVVTFSDITERKQAEELLRGSEARLRMAGRLARVGDWRFDARSGRLRLSAEAAAVGGLPGAMEMAPREALAHFEAASHERLQRAVAVCLADGTPFDEELVLKGPAGREVWVRCLCEAVRDADGRIVILQGAVQDLTEPRRAQADLRLLQACVARLNDVVLVTDTATADEDGPHIVFVNQAFERLTGWRRDEVIGRSPRLLQGPATDRAERRRIGQAVRQQRPVRAEIINYTKQGEAYWIEIDIAPVADDSGRVGHMVAVQRDVSGRKQAEERVLAAQAELQATLAAVPDLLFEVDLDGVFRSIHSPRSDLLPAPPEQCIGRRVMDVLPDAAAGVVMDALQQAQERGRSVGLHYSLPLAGVAHAFELSVACKPPAPGEQPRFVALARDVTERAQAEAQRQLLERQLRESQKMESIGTLAGGVAHDFNNILAAILGNVALARADLSPGHPARASLDQIGSAGLRGRRLVQQILAFSRHQAQDLLMQPLRPLVQETMALLRATLPAGVRLETRLPDEPLAACIDATQLQQVLMNLCTNAWHALPPSGGFIEVGLAAQAPGDSDLQRELPPGPCAHLWVRDNGSGMDAATQARIFDPFFTTKPVGQGTGLGLSVVHGIVGGHGGAIRVDSQPGQGTTFHLYLPAVADAPAAADAVAAPDAISAAEPGGHGQHVLYVDDDEVVVMMVQRLLERAGYRVTACGDAADALTLLRSGADAFDLLVTDYNMPGLSGLELVAELRRLRPALPVIVSSGYISDDLQQRAGPLGVHGLLKKENTFEDLLPMVQSALAAVEAAPRMD